MKRVGLVYGLAVLFVGLAIIGYAKPRLYKWVIDKRVSSDQNVTKSQASRVVPIGEQQVLEIVKHVMTDDLYMALGAYHKSRHQQDAETTPDSVLPEAIIKQQEIDLVDEGYRFILQVKLKKYGNRTRVTAKARPVYRLRDADAEAARDDDSTGGNSIEVNVRADQGSAVAVGPIVIAPVLGLPSDYGINPLPDASDRAAKIVRSFMYFMDKKIRTMKKSNLGQSAPVYSGGQVRPRPSGMQPTGQGGAEVEIDIRTGR